MLKKSISVLIVIVMIISVFTIIPITVEAGTFSNVSGFPDFDMDCFVADLFTTDGHTLNTLIELELNSESRNKLMKNSIESNSTLMGSMTAWQIATFQPSDTSHDTVTQIGYYESIILSALNTSIKSTTVKDTFDNAAIKNGKNLFSSYKNILKADYALEFSDTASFNSLSATEQNSVISSFDKAFKKQFPTVSDISKFLKIFGTIVKSSKSIEECMGLFASYYQCNLVNEYLCQVVNDLYEQCPDSNITMKAALLNISSACSSIELDLGADSLDAIYRGFDILYGVVVDGWFDSVIAASPAGIGILIGQAVGKGVSNFLFSTDEICENYYKICCLDEFEQLTRSVTKHEMENYKKDRTNYNANCLFSALALMFNLNDVGCDLSIDYAKTIYEKSIAGIFLDKTEYENYKKTVEFIRGCKRADYSTLMTSYVFYLEEDYPEIYAAYMKVMDEIENPVVHATGISFSKKHMTLGLEDDMFYFWNNAEVTPSNATNRAVSYTSSDDSVVSIKPGNTLMIELHQTGTATITATAEDGGFTDTMTIEVVEGHGADGIHLENPASDIEASGKCGDNVYWNLYNNGLLKIYGSGNTYNYFYEALSSLDYYSSKTKPTPWYANTSRIISRLYTKIETIIIANGVSSIGDFLFNNCYNLKSITIPDSVTKIGKNAFKSCTELTSITIPDSVVSIDESAFRTCSFSKINVNINNSNYSSLDGNLYNKNKTRLIRYANGNRNEEFIIPNSVTEIDSFAFSSSSSLQRVTIPNTITKINEGTFAYCSNLSKITIPDSVTSIDFGAFFGCSSITSVVIPDSVKSIGTVAFYDCTSLMSVTVPDSVESIGGCSFGFYGGRRSYNIQYGDGDLEQIEGFTITGFMGSKAEEYANDNGFPFESIDSYATSISLNKNNLSLEVGNKETLTATIFPDNIRINSVTWKSSNNSVATVLNGTVTAVSTGTATITATTITGLEASCLVSVNPHTVKVTDISLNKYRVTLEVGSNEIITASVFPNNATDKSISWSSSNTNVATVSNGRITAKSSGTAEITAKTSNGLIATCIVTVIPKTIAATGITLNKSSLSLLVGNSEQLTATVTPSNATDKSVSWYSHSPSIASVSNDGVVSALTPGTAIIKARTSNGVETSCYITVTSISWALDDGTLTISGNGSIEDYAFAARSDIKKVVIQNGVTGIGEYAFYNSKNIESVIIGNSVKEIGYRAFLQCDKLKSITIGSNVESIGESAFYNCPELTSISIPRSVTSIGNYAFYHCLKLNTISVTSNISHLGKEVFYNTAFYNNESNWDNNVLYLNKYLVHVKDSISGLYQIKTGTICIADRVFGGCESLTEVKIPNSVLYLGNWTFDKCTNLKKVSLGNQVRSIGFDAFSGCTSLMNLSIPDSVTSIGDFAFSCCESLTSIVIPNSVTSMGERAFYHCTGLKSITLGNGITDIEYRTFEECTSLANVTFGNSIQTIGEEAFWKCSSIKSIVIPDSVYTIGDSAFDKCTKLENIIIGKNTKTIGTYAFWYCDNLSTVTFSDSVTEISKGAFGQTVNLKDIYYDGSESQWNAITIGEDNECLLNANIHFKTSDKIDPTGVALSKSDISLVIGKNYTLSANVLPSNATNKTVTWTSSDSEVARVINGKVTAYKTGITSITATTSNGKTASCRVIVIPDTDTSGLVGDSDEDGNVTIMDATCVQYFLSYLSVSDSFRWLASDTDRDGDLSITDATYIQRYAAGMIDNFNHPESIALNATSKKLGVGDTFTLNVSFTPSQVMYREIVWTSNNNSVATVNNGKVTAKSVGTATITATTYNGKEAKCSITVAPTPNSVTLNSSSISLNVGGTYQLSATVSPSDANDKTVSWSTSNSAVATVDSTGKITAKSSGSATITATTSNGKKASCTVNVNSIEVSSVSLNAYSITLDEQQTYQLSATVYPSNATNKTLTWSTNNSSVATVTSTGKVTAVSGGTANITAKTTNGKSASCTVTVNEKIMPKSVEVLPKVLTLTVGKTFELNAKITPNNAENKSVSWSSSNSNAVSVDQNGKLVANKAGMSATITARTVNGLTSTVTVDTVKDSKEYYEILNKASQTADKQYWVVFNEGYRNDRIEMSSFTAKQGFKVSWDKGVYCNNQIGECTQYVYNEETKEFVKIGTYSNLTDYATNIIGSNTSIYDSSGNRIVNPYNSQAQSIGALGVKYDETVYSAPVSQGPYYVSSSGDDLYYILNIDCELYQGATLKMYITSGSSGSYSSYSTVLSSNTYDYKTNKGYISISQYLNNHVGQYIRVYTEVVLANKQVIKPANLGTDDAIYLYMN